VTAANAVTLARIALIPLNIYFLYANRPLWAAGLFLLISLTDALDGYIARRYKQTSDLGKLIDPLADKILVISMLIALIDVRLAPAVPVIIIAARDFAVSGLRMDKARKGKVIVASPWGKIKTVSQVVAVLMLILGLPFAVTVLYLAALMTIVSGLEYFIKWAKK